MRTLSQPHAATAHWKARYRIPGSTLDQTKSALVAVAVFLSFCTYLTDTDKSVLYVAALGSVLTCAVVVGISFQGAESLRMLVVFYAGWAAMSIVGNAASIRSFPLEILLYPVIAVLITGALWKVFFIGRKSALFLLGLFLANGGVAVLPIIGIRSLPMLGDIEMGRYIFFTEMPSSAGLLWNVNYYAVTQGTGFWFLMVLLARGSLPSSLRWLVYAVGLSVVLGSSRGATLALLVTFTIFLSATHTGIRVRRILVTTFIIMGVMFAGDVYLALSLDDALNEGLRLYRGLNSRDELWMAGIDAALNSPVLGYGSTDSVKDQLRALGSPTTTVQNAFLTNQLLYGFGGALVFTVLVAVALSKLVRVNFDNASAAVYALFLFILLDSFVRSYVVGGIGLMPLMLLASGAYLWRLNPKAS